jgi:hypothetical protein
MKMTLEGDYDYNYDDLFEEMLELLVYFGGPDTLIQDFITDCLVSLNDEKSTKMNEFLVIISNSNIPKGLINSIFQRYYKRLPTDNSVKINPNAIPAKYFGTRVEKCHLCIASNTYCIWGTEVEYESIKFSIYTTSVPIDYEDSYGFWIDATCDDPKINKTALIDLHIFDPIKGLQTYKLKTSPKSNASEKLPIPPLNVAKRRYGKIFTEGSFSNYYLVAYQFDITFIE